MAQYVTTKKLPLICVIFLLCPKRSRLSLEPQYANYEEKHSIDVRENGVESQNFQNEYTGNQEDPAQHDKQGALEDHNGGLDQGYRGTDVVQSNGKPKADGETDADAELENMVNQGVNIIEAGVNKAGKVFKKIKKFGAIVNKVIRYKNKRILYKKIIAAYMKKVRKNIEKSIIDNYDDSPNKLKEVMKDQAQSLWTGVENAEPGFDLTEEEMVKFKIWPQGIIPFYIDQFSFDTILSTRLRDTLVSVKSVTGLHFIEIEQPPKDESSRWVLFINRRGELPCVDYTTQSFTNTGVQKVVIGYDCLGREKALASMVLALAGVPPQHNAPNRDDNIKINMNNILPDKVDLFKKLADNEWLFHDVDYDFNSAGHYDLFQYTANGKATLTPIMGQDITVGDEGLSYGDIWKIRMLYNYIIRKRPRAQASDCSRLFEPGNSFNKYQPESDDEITPRKKPNKYMGLAEETPRPFHGSSHEGPDTSNNIEETQEDQAQHERQDPIIPDFEPPKEPSKMESRLIDPDPNTGRINASKLGNLTSYAKLSNKRLLNRSHKNDYRDLLHRMSDFHSEDSTKR